LSTSKEYTLQIEDVELIDLYGANNNKLALVRKAFPLTKITSRGNTIKVKGDADQAKGAIKTLEEMIKLLKAHGELKTQSVQDLIGGENPIEYKLAPKNPSNIILHGRNSKPITARTKNQKKLVTESEANDLVFAIGPAGTGKTYTAVALAVRALKNKIVKKIILTRPAVEAGENLGFLPGGLEDKIDPYLRPLYDALNDMLPLEKMQYFTTNRIIEVAPLAFMRGRTLDNAFIILDEAFNTSRSS